VTGIRNVELSDDGGYCINSKNATLVDDFEFVVLKWVALMVAYRGKINAQADLKDNLYFHALTHLNRQHHGLPIPTTLRIRGYRFCGGRAVIDFSGLDRPIAMRESSTLVLSRTLQFLSDL
jgi:hypothetical protein